MQRLGAAAGRNMPLEIFNFDRTARLNVSIMSPHAPWLRAVPARIETPAMISHEEAQYYTYLGLFYEGRGRAVKLGPWIGASTRHVVLSLARNPRFAGERLHVFDDFTWRNEWMDPYVAEEERLPNHACFQYLFDKYTENVRRLLDIERVRITDYDGNEGVPILSWCGDPIEILYVDCGRTYVVNDAWYNHLEPSFIPGRTLIVIKDWRTHRQIPRSGGIKLSPLLKVNMIHYCRFAKFKTADWQPSCLPERVRLSRSEPDHAPSSYSVETSLPV